MEVRPLINVHSKTGIERAIKDRNDLRRGVLPLLDERQEIKRAQAVVRDWEDQRIEEEHQQMFHKIYAETLEKFRRNCGPDFCNGFASHYLVSMTAHQRFRKFLKDLDTYPSSNTPTA
ncbi:hypothetical protein [Azospirillum sp.]|uniref:hypothetical protein n=1 Tax=Azospirillum sp. TaxID=34012 RepID=UPI00261BBB6F|nr:hypothetical protein [Azospirillum sp.]